MIDRLRDVVLTPNMLTKLIETLLIIIMIGLIRSLLLRMVYHRTEEMMTRYHWQKISSYAAMVFIVLLVIPLWLDSLRNLATYLGLLSAGVAIALQRPLTDMVGWIFLIWRQPFRVGDRIQIDRHAGDVIDIRLFQFSLMEIGNWVDADQSTGRVIHVPNGRVFTDPLANYTGGFNYIWNEIVVTVTFDSDWQRAKELLLEIVNRHANHLGDAAREKLKQASHRMLIIYSTLTPTVYTSGRENGVRLTLRYLCEPRTRRGTAEAIWEDLLRAFAEHPRITFAYPAQRIYFGSADGAAPESAVYNPAVQRD